MTCRACGRALPDDARFCSGCGAAVVTACSSCGTELEADARFCRRCGQPLGQPTSGPGQPEAGPTAAPAAREAGRERKVATLLFADVVGFTAMNEAHDPELVSSVVSAAFERLADEVRRYEGTIEKFAGDAMLAVFGVPTAHEDDPERAVRAALEMQAVTASLANGAGDGSELKLRIGIATGEVLADRTRASSERDLFVTGDAVNIAARLQSAAEPGAVLVESSTYAATRDAVDYAELAALALKGKELPVAAWRAVSVKAGRGGRRARVGLQAPLVGRDAELTLLKETVRRTAEEGKPHLVTIIGSAGVGKSRLTWELEKYLDGLPDVFHWRKGRCLAYSGASFGPVADVIKVDARIADDDGPAAAREKLLARLTELELDAGTGPLLDALEAVLAIGDGREHARDELFESWRRYLDGVASVAPLVLVVEDIHWADDGVLAFLDFLARWAEAPMVILCLARHELLERRSTWGGGLPNATTIVLEPLGQAASAALMGGLLDGGVPESLGVRIIELAEGNPLFVEEMVRMLVDRGVLRFGEGRWELAGTVDEVEIPGSVQAVLAARLDTLPTAEKRIAQDAAVVGRIFWDVVVAHLAGSTRNPTDELLRRLRVKDLVVHRSPSSLADATEYGFRHVLIRDVAYDSLPKRDRSRLHRDVALWAEAELADRIDEFSELIASHLAAALAYEEEFSADPAELRVIRELTQAAALRAARRASAMSHLDAGSRWLKLALDLAWKLDAPPRQVAQLTVEYAGEAWETIDPTERNAVLARASAGMLTLEDRTAEDEELLASLRDERGHALYDLDDVEGSQGLLRAAIAELEAGPPTPGRAKLLTRLGWTYWRSGQAEEAVPILQQAVEEARVTDSAWTLGWATHDLGIALGYLRRYEESIQLLEDSLSQAKAVGDRGLLMRCYINIPAIRQARGDPPEPLAAMVAEGLQLARRSAASHTIVWLAGNQAEFMLDMGRPSEAIGYLDEAIQHADSISNLHRSSKRCTRALIRQLMGDIDGARLDVAEAARIGLNAEPQAAWSHPLAAAMLQWLDDPHAAAVTLAAWLEEHVDTLSHAHDAVVVLARMALRLDDSRLVAEAIRLDRLSRSTADSDLHRAKAAWIETLATGDRDTVEVSARTLEGLGLRRYAAEAWADAALMAARAGATSEAEERALALSDEMGLQPWLGRPPENRWLETGTPQASEASPA